MAASTSAKAKAAALEGLDFIETEEDVKAVEAATLKIQSTFRGKKFRSKLTPASKATPEEGSSGAKQQQAEDKKEAVQVNKSAGQQQTSSKTTTTSSTTEAAVSTTKSSKKPECSDSELSKRIGAMQVNDNNNEEPQIPGGLSEDEAERAATKIQAGFKGYKTRKELEGKLPAGSAGGAQQAAPSGCQPDK